MTRTSPARRWPAVVVAIAAPLALVVLLLAAAWAPADALPRVKAAVVNLDQPVTVQGQYTPLGRQLASALTSGDDVSANFDWVVTDQDDAAAGLADGTYAAAVTIPKNFSAAATSFTAAVGGGSAESGMDDADGAGAQDEAAQGETAQAAAAGVETGTPASTPQQATVEVTTPEGATAVDQVVATAVATAATRVLGEQLTTTYVENVLVGFSTLKDQLGQAADGATQLADGTRQLADGTGQLATGADGLAGGASQLADGVRQTDAGAGQLADGSATLGSGLTQAVDQLPTTPEDQRANLAQVVTAPVAAPSSTVTAPLGRVSTLVAVALWIGALVLFLAFRPLPARAAGSTSSCSACAIRVRAIRTCPIRRRSRKPISARASRAPGTRRSSSVRRPTSAPATSSRWCSRSASTRPSPCRPSRSTARCGG